MAKPSNIVDVYVGARLRMRRMILRMSQSELGELLGVTFQQIQKYENGSNRISMHRLRLTARALEVSPSYFFEGVLAPVSEGGIASRPDAQSRSLPAPAQTARRLHVASGGR
jgi:transcriptional regulator with XRE-family HTH domain